MWPGSFVEALFLTPYRPRHTRSTRYSRVPKVYQQNAWVFNTLPSAQAPEGATLGSGLTRESCPVEGGRGGEGLKLPLRIRETWSISRRGIGVVFFLSLCPLLARTHAHCPTQLPSSAMKEIPAEELGPRSVRSTTLGLMLEEWCSTGLRLGMKSTVTSFAQVRSTPALWDKVDPALFLVHTPISRTKRGRAQEKRD